MSMIDEKLYQMTELEFRADHDVQQAVTNVRQISGFYSVDSSTIRQRFKDFKEDKVEKFKDSAEYQNAMVELFPNESDKMICRSMLSQVKEKSLCWNMITEDGRIGYCIEDSKFFAVDLFHGEVRSVPLEGFDYMSQIEFVSDERFLVKVRSSLTLFKFDLDTMKLDRLDSAEIDERIKYSTVVLDQLDNNKFFIHGIYSRYSTGRILENRIVLDDFSRLDTSYLHFVKLTGNQLHGLKTINCVWHYCKLDLDTDTLQSVEVPTTFDFGIFSCYTWSESRFYIPIQMSNRCYKIVALDSETRIWSDTGIVLMSRPRTLFVDQDEVLTAIAEGPNCSTVIHRFPLKKPDSLINLAWFALARKFKMFDMSGYKALINCLPYTCEIRWQLPEIVQDEPRVKKPKLEADSLGSL